MSREKPLIAADSADLINILKSFAKLPAKAQTDYLSLFYSQNSHQDFGKMVGKTWILKHLCIEYVWPISFHVPPPSLTFGYSHLSCLPIVRLETPEFRSRYTENNYYLWTILKALNSHGFRLFYLTCFSIWRIDKWKKVKIAELERRERFMVTVRRRIKWMKQRRKWLKPANVLLCLNDGQTE